MSKLNELLSDAAFEMARFAYNDRKRSVDMKFPFGYRCLCAHYSAEYEDRIVEHAKMLMKELSRPGHY